MSFVRKIIKNNERRIKFVTLDTFSLYTLMSDNDDGDGDDDDVDDAVDVF